MNSIYFLTTLFFFFLSTASSDNHELTITPGGQNNTRSTYLVKSGEERFVLQCLYQGDEIDVTHALQWYNENNHLIKNSQSIKILHKTNEKKLIFTKIKEHDTGVYKCRVQLKNNGFIEKKISIKVISRVIWTTDSDTISGNLDESLTVDCNAQGDPQPLIEIADKYGQSIAEKNYTVINNQVTIPKLTKKHNNLVFKCLAIQKISLDENVNDTITEEHNLIVKVNYAPEFDSPEVETFATTGRNVTLNCIVMASYPPVEHFYFYRGDDLVPEIDRYKFKVNIQEQAASLEIDSVEDGDYGRYKCVAHNGKLQSEQVFVLKKTAPPKQPTVELSKVLNNSVILHIYDNSDASDDLPVLSYSISYAPKKQTINRATRGEQLKFNDEENSQNLEQYRQNFHKTSTGEYEIKNLKSNADYEASISAINEVGEGDPVLINFSTSPLEKIIKKVTYSSSKRLKVSILLTFVLLCAMAIV